MVDLSLQTLDFALLSFFASIVNGGVGYGFSSIVTPIALLWTTSKILNPALVLVELVVNVALLIRERKFIGVTYRRSLPVIYGVLPGVIVGSLGLVLISAINVKVVVYLVLLPLTILQLLGVRRQIVREQHVGPALGLGVGFLYSLTTISGPPLALFWRNQGLSKDEFRCAIAQIRVAEASFTGIAYLVLNLYSGPSLALFPVLFLPVLIGVPLGTVVLQSLSRDFFSRLVMAVDGMFVSYGLYSVVTKAGWVSTPIGETFVIAAFVLLTVLLVRVVLRLPALTAATEQRLLAASGGGEGRTLPAPSEPPP